MYDKQIYNIFNKKVHIDSNGTDQFYGSIPSEKRNAARHNFNINFVEEEILAIRDTSFWNDVDQGVVITDWGIYCIPDNDDEEQNFSIPWKSIENIIYKDECIYFYDNDNDLLATIHQSLFLKDSFSKMFSLVNTFKEMASTSHDVDADGIYNEFFDLTNDKTVDIQVKENRANDLLSSDTFNDYGKALIYIRLASSWVTEYNETFNDDSKFAALDWKEKNNIRTKALEHIQDYALKAINIVPEEKEAAIKADAGWYFAWACHRKGDHLTAVRVAIECLEGAEGDDATYLKQLISGKPENDPYNRKLIPNSGYGFYGDSIERVKEIFDQQYTLDLKEAQESGDEEFIELVELERQDNLDQLESGEQFFSHRPYHDRQFIFVVRDLDKIAGCYDSTDNVKYVFTLDEMPGDITFPLGHPQANTLYFAHPLRPYYIPVEKANLTLFFEKVQEMGRLLQCLGATEVTFRCLKGHKIDESTSNTINAGGYAGNRVAHIEGNGKLAQTESSFRNSHDEMSETKFYNPTRKPYCPDDLIWAAMDPDLNAIVKERLEGGLLTFNKKVSSLETMNVSSSRIADVQATFENFMVKVSANYNAQTDRTFSETSETVWEISAKFKPLEEFENSTVPVNSDACLKPATNLISQSTKESLSEDEKEYVEFFKECLNDDDGELSPRSRKILDRFAQKSGLSPERAKVLEDSVLQSNLTEGELDYINEYKEMLEDGEISQRERKLLDKICRLNGITPERAKDLESLL